MRPTRSRPARWIPALLGGGGLAALGFGYLALGCPHRRTESLPLADGSRLEATILHRRDSGELYVGRGDALTLVVVSPEGARQTLRRDIGVASSMTSELRRYARVETAGAAFRLRTPVGVWIREERGRWRYEGWSVTGADPIERGPDPHPVPAEDPRLTNPGADR